MSAAAKPLKVVMIGATGAVGGELVKTLLRQPALQRLSLLGRRPVAGLAHPAVHQHTVDVLQPDSYRAVLDGHDTAVCTLGVGQPSQMSFEEFVRIDRDSVLALAGACRAAGVRHFELLGSVGANASSRSAYLRTKGELVEGLKALGFERLSLCQPSMILTPTNRYGLSQAITLRVMPWLNPLLLGSARKYRGISVERLGAAMALQLVSPGSGVQTLHWPELMALSAGPT
jgi:uncharacterized protein YbjT (DUF2867 family)